MPCHGAKLLIPAASRPDLESARSSQRLLAAAFEAEVESHLATYRDVRDGLRPPADGTEVPPFRSKILPPYLLEARSIEELLPWLYLKGVSTGGSSSSVPMEEKGDAGRTPPPPGLMTLLVQPWSRAHGQRLRRGSGTKDGDGAGKARKGEAGRPRERRLTP